MVRSLRFEAGWDPLSPSRRITITLMDGLSGTSNLLSRTIAVQTVFKPTIHPLTAAVVEGAPKGTTVATLAVSDVKLTAPVYSLVSGEGATDNSAFMISGSQLQLKKGRQLRMQSQLKIRVQVHDPSGFTLQQVLTINVRDVNESPTSMASQRKHLRAEQGRRSDWSTVSDRL